MSHTIRLKKGFDINLIGKAQRKTGACDQPETFAIKPSDFPGIERPKVTVNEGDTVKAGTPLMFCKMMERVLYCSPVSGEVVEIKRGDKRKLLEIKILADREVNFEAFKKFAASDLGKLDKKDIIEQILNSGVWPNIIQRPYGVVANPDDTPKSIFISTFDSHPLAPDIAYTLQGEQQYFQVGVDVLGRLTSGKVHIGVNGDAKDQFFTSVKNAEINTITGIHPAGNVGVHIHHIDPIGKGDLLWTVSPYGVAQIGKLFTEGRYDASKLIALTGEEVSQPQYFKTFTGACVNKLAEKFVNKGELRIISGNVLTGEKIASTGYMGFYHNQITAIREGHYSEFLGWFDISTKKLSAHKAFGLLSFLNGKNKEYSIDTSTKGEKRAFVQTGAFEKVTPIDILPTYLFKAIMAEDYDDMEALGIYEVVEEDVALCEFVDVSKHNLQEILREGLNLMKNS
ncbi:MAG: Na(+)-translocating NADH-quinone reductase subunit A [Cyclobacteriaceae bacterium]|nr:Na(+)-translocating NADH-quinone reductase subunit A [Cyclobacteriaceae bacterium]